MKRFLLSLLLISSIIFTSCGISKETKNASPATPILTEHPEQTPINQQSESARFDAFTDSIFKKELSLNILNLHSTFAHPEDFGINDYAISLGSFSAEEESMSYVCLKEYLNLLSTFDYQALTEQQQFTYDIFKTYCEDSLKFEGFRLYTNYLSPTNGIQAYLPTLLSNYTFYDEQDIQDYFATLKLFPSFFVDLITFSKEQAEAGLFMADTQTNSTIASCRQFLSNPEQHYLIDSFNVRLEAVDFLDTDARNTYKAKHIDILKESVFPAYEYLITELQNLKGRCKNQYGLAWFERGKEYYELLVRDTTGSEKSVETLQDLIEENLRSDFNMLVKLGLEHPEAFRNMDVCPVDLSNPEAVLLQLKEQIENDFPTCEDVEFSVQTVPKAIEEYTNPAYYILPPLDMMNQNYIFINQSAFLGGIEDFVTLAHEGFPGHLYQTTYFYGCEPCHLRKLFSFNGYCEGWGTYAELYAYTISGTDEITARLNQLNKSYSLAIYCLADIGIHYEGWTFDEAMGFFKELGLDTEIGTSIYETLVANPAVYLSYYVGYLEIMELKTLAKERLQERFDLKEFHQFILETGPAPFELIRKKLEIWIDGHM